MDDDNYVNPPALLKLLKTFSRTRDVYVGRPSLNRPIHASEPQPHNRTVGGGEACRGRGPEGRGQGQPSPEGGRWAGVGCVLWLSGSASLLCVWAGSLVSDPQFPR